MKINNTATIKAMVHHMPGLFSRARTTPKPPIRGAISPMRISIKLAMRTWSTSFVVRVISEAVEKLSNSALVKSVTLRKTSERKSLATLAEVIENEAKFREQIQKFNAELKFKRKLG